MDDTYDVIVIGAGPVGQNVTERSRAAGLSVAVVERELVGGECSYWGCVPSKALLRPVLAVADARKVDGAREAVDGSICADGVFGRRDRYTTNYDDTGQANWVKATGADLIRGHGRLGRTASGCRRHPRRRHRDADGPARRRHLHRQHGRAARPPRYRRSAAVDQPAGDRQQLGARPVGGRRRRRCRRRNGHGLAGFGLRGHAARPPVGRAAADGAVRRGTGRRVASRRRVWTCASASRSPSCAGPVAADRSRSRSTTAASWRSTRSSSPPAGRRCTDDIGLETVGLTPGSWLDVDDTCRVRDVADGWLYAMGDVNHRALLTHQGKYQARMAAGAIAARAAGQPVGRRAAGARHAATADTHAVPQVVFTDPEAAAVGLSARRRPSRRGIGSAWSTYDLGEVVRGPKLVRRRLHRPGPDGRRPGPRARCSASPSSAQASANCCTPRRSPSRDEVPIDRLWHAVPCFPTISEVWLRLLEAYRDA